MSMRTSSVFTAVLLLAGCGSGGGQSAAAGGEGASAGAGATTVSPESAACALAGAKDFAQTCTIEHATQDGAPILVLHHPDGGFRRLEARSDGTLAAADGAEAVTSIRQGATIEVAVSNDRYRIPASALGHARP